MNWYIAEGKCPDKVRNIDKDGREYCHQFFIEVKYKNESLGGHYAESKREATMMATILMINYALEYEVMIWEYNNDHNLYGKPRRSKLLWHSADRFEEAEGRYRRTKYGRFAVGE